MSMSMPCYKSVKEVIKPVIVDDFFCIRFLYKHSTGREFCGTGKYK